jgi:hypothetical protein
VLGSDDGLAALEKTGLFKEAPASFRGPLPQVVRTLIATGGTSVNRKAARGVDSGRIVALSRDTWKELAKYGPTRVKSYEVV